MPQALKLYAAETDDMEILSAALEGLITSPGEIGFLKKRRAFTVVGSRFKWEDASPRAALKGWTRIRTGVYFGDILKVRSSGISRSNSTEVMELLNITTSPGEDGTAEFLLNFAGGGTICLEAECINVTLTDSGEPWPTDKRPEHPDSEKTD
ncbi:MAG: DUF2948 family protein [Alphaproteobacteria bacterium]|nr:MAG: DUF2948 family protein [Alphaproteobacteria bacterium]